MIYTIDPGVHHCSMAVWRNGGELVRADLIPVPDGESSKDRGLATKALAHTVVSRTDPFCQRLFVIERQVVYPGMPRTDLNDLLDLSMVTGALCGAIQSTGFILDIRLVTPFEWKGNAPKVMMTERIKSKLTHEEHAKLRLTEKKSLDHNIYDAVGIGLWLFKRLNRRNVGG